MEAKSKIDNLFIHVKDYLEERVKLISLNLHEKTSKAVSNVASGLIMFILAIFILLFLSLAASWWIGRALEEPALGFLIVGAFYILLTTLIYMNRAKWIGVPLMNVFLKNIADEED
jgi:glycerol uptake facilitator-like aquaporin